MTPEEKALRDAWLAEMWKPCRELSPEEKVRQRIKSSTHATYWSSPSELRRNEVGRHESAPERNGGCDAAPEGLAS